MPPGAWPPPTEPDPETGQRLEGVSAVIGDPLVVVPLARGLSRKHPRLILGDAMELEAPGVLKGPIEVMRTAVLGWFSADDTIRDKRPQPNVGAHASGHEDPHGVRLRQV
jgi:hypothetical protein